MKIWTNNSKFSVRISRVIVWMLLICCTSLFATNRGLDSDIGEEFGYSDPAIVELAQFDYLRGNWRITMQMKNEEGKFVEIKTTFFLKAYFHDDKRTFQSVFTSDKGFFSTDIRSYDLISKKWRGLFLNAKAQRWHNFEAELVGDKMETIIKGGYSGKEDFDIKTVHSDIRENSFTNRVFQSRDGGNTWQLTYISNYVRL